MRTPGSFLALLAGIAATAAIPLDAPYISPPTFEVRDITDAVFTKIIEDANITTYVKPTLNRDITEWLAIGDSFSAGISADVPNDQLNWYCSRFRKSYPNQMNENSRFPGYASSRTFTFGSCTGATMSDILDKQLELGDPDDSNYPKIGKPQIATVSLSGNDLKFGEVSVPCTLPTHHGWQLIDVLLRLWTLV